MTSIIKKIGFLFVVVMLCAAPVDSHTLGASFFSLQEQSPGSFTTTWLPSKMLTNVNSTVEIRYPEACTVGELGLSCGKQPLAGELVFANLPLHAEVIVRVQRFSGDESTEIITGQNPVVLLAGDAVGNGTWQVLSVYLTLGAEHIVFGYDHLLFVFGLLLLVGFGRNLLLTVTAFTLAHSITLALSMLKVLAITPLFVEITIALSIVLVAVESLRKYSTFTYRHPAVIAFLFGLIHGFGFAGALKDIGLPDGAFALSLLAFNLGVELGQIAVLIFLYGIYRLVAGAQGLVIFQGAANKATGYIIGACGTFWFVERLVS